MNRRASAGVALFGVLLSVGIWQSRLRQPAETSAPAEPELTRPAIPVFAQPEQEQKYREALSTGSQRAIAALSAARSAAVAAAEPNPAVVARLDELLAEKHAQLAAAEAERP